MRRSSGDVSWRNGVPRIRRVPGTRYVSGVTWTHTPPRTVSAAMLTHSTVHPSFQATTA